mgnify:CR=1 FL=1
MPKPKNKKQKNNKSGSIRSFLQDAYQWGTGNYEEYVSAPLRKSFFGYDPSLDAQVNKYDQTKGKLPYISNPLQNKDKVKKINNLSQQQVVKRSHNPSTQALRNINASAMHPMGYEPRQSVSSYLKSATSDKALTTENMSAIGQKAEQGDPKSQRRMDAFLFYSGLPQRYNSLTISDYEAGQDPSFTFKNENLNYNILRDAARKTDLIDKVRRGEISEDYIGSEKYNKAEGAEKINKAGFTDTRGNVMWNATYGIGYDEKQPYVSYYDRWDLAPADIIGNAYDMYNRKYLDKQTIEDWSKLENVGGGNVKYDKYNKKQLDKQAKKSVKNIKEKLKNLKGDDISEYSKALNISQDQIKNMKDKYDMSDNDVINFLDREKERYLNYTEGYDEIMKNRKYLHPSERSQYALGGWINEQLGIKDNSFFGKATDVVGDYATSVADTTMGLVGAGDVIQDEDYETKAFGKFSDTMSQDVAPVAGKVIATGLAGPVGGAAMGAVQQGVGKATPNEARQKAQKQRQQMKQRQQGIQNLPGQQFQSQYTSPYQMPLGGMVPYGEGSDVELEKGETYRTPAGVIKQVPDGSPTHANGGQDMTLPIGTEVLGKLKNSKDKKYKDLGRRLERAYNNYQKVIKGNPTPIAKRTAEMNLANVQKEYSKLMSEQEQQKGGKGSYSPSVPSMSVYANGGPINGDTTLGPGGGKTNWIDPVVVTADRPNKYRNFNALSTWATNVKKASEKGEDVGNVPVGSLTGDTNLDRLSEEDIVRFKDVGNLPSDIQNKYGFNQVKFAKGGQVMQDGGYNIPTLDTNYVSNTPGETLLDRQINWMENKWGNTTMDASYQYSLLDAIGEKYGIDALDSEMWTGGAGKIPRFTKDMGGSAPNYEGRKPQTDPTYQQGLNQVSFDQRRGQSNSIGGGFGQFGLTPTGSIRATGGGQQAQPTTTGGGTQQGTTNQANQTQQPTFPNRGQNMQSTSGIDFTGIDTGGVDNTALASPDAELMTADTQLGNQLESQLGGTNAPGGDLFSGGSGMGLGTALGTAAQFAPALYNLGRGLFGEQADTDLDYQANPYEQRVLNLMGDRRYNVQPQLRAAERASRIAQRNLRETGASPAQYLANLSGVQAQRQQGISKALAQKQNVENQYRRQQAQMMQQMGSREAQRRQQLANQNLQRRLASQAAQDRMVSQGLTQLGAGARGVMQDAQRRRNTQQLIGGWNQYLQGADISSGEGLTQTPQMMDIFKNIGLGQ